MRRFLIASTLCVLCGVAFGADYSRQVQVDQANLYAGAVAEAYGSGDLIFVNSTNGNDGNDGESILHPVLKLSRAVALAGAGDTIILNPGGSETVTATTTISVANLSIVCPVSNPDQGFVVTGAGTLNLLTVSASGTTVKGLHFVHTGATANQACITVTDGVDNVTVDGCSFDNSAVVTTFTGLGVEVVDECEDVQILNSVFRDMHRGVMYLTASGKFPQRMLVDGCTFIVGRATAFGIHSNPTSTGQLENAVVSNCVFIEADGDGDAATDAWDGSTGADAASGPLLFGALVKQALITNCVSYDALAVSFDTLANVHASATASLVGNVSATGGDIETKIDVIDAYHDVATADAATNAVMSDVIGNKTDAAVEAVTTDKTLMAYQKGVNNVLAGTVGIATWAGAAAPAANVSISEVLEKVHDDVVVVDAFHDVGVADAATNVVMSDVIGNKTDAIIQAAAADKSVTAYAKGTVDALTGTAGIATWAAATAPANAVSISEAVRYSVEKQLPRIVEKTDGGLGGATVNLFTVTGEVEIVSIVGVCTTAIARAGGAVTLEVGTSDDTDILLGTITDVRVAENDVICATDDAQNAGIFEDQHFIVSSATIIQTIDVAADSGAITWFCIYIPLSSDGAVVAA